MPSPSSQVSTEGQKVPRQKGLAEQSMPREKDTCNQASEKKEN